MSNMYIYLVDIGEHAEEVPLVSLLGQDPGEGLHVPAALHRVPPRVEPGHRRVRDDEVSVAGNLFTWTLKLVWLFKGFKTFRIKDFLRHQQTL